MCLLMELYQLTYMLDINIYSVLKSICYQSLSDI